MIGNFLRTIGLISALTLAACSTGPSGYDMYMVSEDDVRIIEGAKALLVNEDSWTRNEETQCDLKAENWTLFCALQKASYDVLGEYQLRRPAIEEVRTVAEEMLGRTLERRLIDFNNDPDTSFEDIIAALDIALERIKARLPAA